MAVVEGLVGHGCALPGGGPPPNGPFRVDAGVLVAIFVWYAIRLAAAPPSEPELLGTPAWVGEQDRGRRRGVYIGMFAFAALVILASAEHFADGLVQTGSELGVDQFLLVQWVAPVASEAPDRVRGCRPARSPGSRWTASSASNCC